MKQPKKLLIERPKNPEKSKSSSTSYTSSDSERWEEYQIAWENANMNTSKNGNYVCKSCKQDVWDACVCQEADVIFARTRIAQIDDEWADYYK